MSSLVTNDISEDEKTCNRYIDELVGLHSVQKATLENISSMDRCRMIFTVFEKKFSAGDQIHHLASALRTCAFNSSGHPDRPLPTTERSVRMDEILHEPRMSGALPVPKPPTQLSGCKRRKLEASATTSNKRHRGVNQQRERSETFSTDELSIAWENRHDAPNNRPEGSRMEGKSIGFSQTRFLWIPNDREDGGGYWLGMHDVADVFRQDLERKLFKSYQADPKREKLFHRMQNEPATYFAKGRCVNNVTYARKAMRCVDEGGNDKRACNQCSKAKRLCVRVVKHEDAYCFGIYPLGSAHRVGKSWDEMGFWLKDRTVKTTRKSTQ